MRLPRIAALFAMLAILAGNAHAAACELARRGTVPIETPGGNLLVTVSVNDTDATFILDTGAERTLVSEEAVRDLGLQRDDWASSTVQGLGGVQRRPNALPRSLRLGDVPLRRNTLSGDSSVTVGPLPVSEIAGRPIAGLLGRDFLAPFDLDLDMPASKLTLYDVRGCTTGFLPWTTPYAAIPAGTLVGTAMVLQVTVDGKAMRALLDTGASATLITAPGMFRLGLTQESMRHDPVGNGAAVGPMPVPMRLHQFTELRVGPTVMRQPRFWVAAARVVPVVDMLLGADWLQARHVWLSFATQQIFVALR